MGGGGSKVQNIGAQKATATPEQNKLLQNQMDWFANLGPSINQLTNLGASSLQNVPQFNYGQMYNANMPQQQNIQNNLNGLAQGKLPDGYADEQRKYIENSMNNSMGTTMAQWANKGLVNSSMAQRAFGDVSGWASNQLQQNHLQNIASAGNALNQSQQSLWSPMQYAQQAQEAAMALPTQSYTLAGQLNQQIADLLSQLMGQQTALSSPAQTIVTQKSSPWGAVGSLAGSLGSAAIACFPAGTLIHTPRGEVAIEELRKNDTVFGEDYQDEVIVQTYKADKPELFVVYTDKGVLKTTRGQRLMLVGDELCEVENLQPGDRLIFREDYAKVSAIDTLPEKTTVYELDTTGDNLFWADGFLVEGMVQVWV